MKKKNKYNNNLITALADGTIGHSAECKDFCFRLPLNRKYQL